MSKRLVAVICFFLMMICVGVSVSNAKETDIPSSLKPWKDWVLHGEENKSCPIYYNNGEEYCCIWPSRLNLSLHEKGGTFEQQWLVLAEGWVPLPGNTDTWPMDVQVNGAKVPVLERNEAPSISLKPGEYTVKGTFSWAQMPEMILVPSASGIVKLSIDDKEVSSPLQEKDGRLWLKRSQVIQDVEDRIDVRVYRLISDNIPMEITTLIKLNVSGKAREVPLENVLLEGFLPMEITSSIPARIAKDVNLTVQVRPGQWEIYIKSRSLAPINSLGPIKTSYGQEIWAFQPQNDLRMVQIEGVSAVDPTQTDSPAEWRQYSTYIINNDNKIIFKESSRGDANPSPDRLSLNRTWWLDFNGDGFTLKDNVSGTMSRQWRLDMNPPVTLGRVALDGVDQLITSQGEDKKPGVELRKGQLNMTAESRIESHKGTYSAVGWDHEFQSVSGTLNLPPGWRLITASGVDVIEGSWFQKWTLLDLFLVLIMSLAVFKLWGRWQGVLTLVTLVLIYHESDAPKFIWLSLLASLALLRFVPEGWIRRIANLWRIGSIVVLLVLAIPFMVQQVRWGIYPQLEPHYEAYGTGIQYIKLNAAPPIEKINAPKVTTDEEAALEVKAPEPVPQQEDASTSDKKWVPVQKRSISSSLSSNYSSNQAIRVIDNNALNQTGPGLPNWNWRSFSMRWNGPVEKDQNISFWLLSPFVNLILSFVRVILLALLILILLVPDTWKCLGKRISFISVLALALLLPGISNAQTTNDGFPPDRLLEELKKRLLETSDCLPSCAEIQKMEITATSGALQIRLQVDAARDTVIPLPVSMDSWLPDQVLIESSPAKGLMRDNDGTLRLLVRKGTQAVTLRGSISAANDFQIPLALTPHRVTFSGDGWEIQGIDEEGRAESGLKLIRKQKDSGKKTGETDQTTVPAFFQVERTLSLGLDWQVRNRITRMAPAGSTELITIPILAGESVTTAGIRVENGMVHLQMAPDVQEMEWDSTLKKEAALTLKAPSFVSWSETWTLETSSIWHCDFSGIPVIHQQDSEGTYRPQWRPWPGEEVTIKVSKPEAVQGQVVTIDKASLTYTPGDRFSLAVLSLNIRTSKGGQHRIVLPEGAKVQSISIAGNEQPINTQGREITLPLQPGEQSIGIEWHQASGSSMLVRAPEITIGDKAVNADVTFNLPQSRWILWTVGPRLGPAVLFWSYLFVIILAALALGRISWTPLKTRHWLLLGLGLTQVHPLIAIMVVGWFLALGQRQKGPVPKERFVFDAMQIFLVIWTVAALVGLYMAIQKGLLGIPNMQISGNESSDFNLHWTQDRISNLMPRPMVFSLHLMIFRFLMLAWALWLAYSLLKWLKWGWGCFHEGDVWQKLSRKKKVNDAVRVPPDLPMREMTDDGPGKKIE